MKIVSETYTYKKVGNCLLKADVYKSVKAYSPAIVFIHGGALILGSRKSINLEQVELFTQNGYTIVSIDYRLAPETKLESIVEDVYAAIKWIKVNGNIMFGIDTEKIAVVGKSAGGYLGLMSGTWDLRPKAIVSFYGYGDILADWACIPSEFYRIRPLLTKKQAYKVVEDHEISEGGEGRTDFYYYCRQQGIWTSVLSGYDLAIEKDKLTRFCPAYNVDKYYPPTLLLHGNKDTDVPYEQSLQMRNELVKCRIANQIITIAGGEHGFDHDINSAVVKSAFKTLLTFLNRYIN